MTLQDTPYMPGSTVPVAGWYVCGKCRHATRKKAGTRFQYACARCGTGEGEGTYWFLLFDAAG